MKSCLCGNPVDGVGALCNRCIALRILELGQDATDTEVRAAYLTLVKVWQPERFESETALKEKVETKLNDIHSAHEFLTMTLGERAIWRRPRHWSEDPALNGMSSEERSAAKEKTISLRKLMQRLSRLVVPAFKGLFALVILVIAVLACRYLWIAFDVPGPTSQEVAKAYDDGKDGLRKELEEPKRRLLQALRKDLAKLDPQFVAPGPAAQSQAEQTTPEVDSQSSRKAPSNEAERQQAKSETEPRKAPYITIGSTRDAVLAQLGPPTASSESKLVYGRSELYLKDGSVIGWRIDPASDPIRVKLWPEHPVDTSQNYFTVGSTKDDVLAVQGTPAAFSKNKFEYGGSEVYFQNDRVVRWKNDRASIPLRAKLP